MEVIAALGLNVYTRDLLFLLGVPGSRACEDLIQVDLDNESFVRGTL